MFALAAPLLAAQVMSSGADDLALAWQREGRIQTRLASAAALPDQAPLGSLWKLFVFAYAVERGVAAPPYRCGSPLRPGEEYCCGPGQSVERDRALARSCGRFFAPRRLGIEASAWRAFWAPKTDQGAAWLADLNRLRPETRLGVPQILAALAVVPAPARAALARALLPVMLDGYGRGVASHLGGLLRVKTFTWTHPLRAQATWGGAAGWLVDGTPVWFGGTGASRNVLSREAARLATWLPAPRGGPADEACVVVDYLERYPIRTVDRLPSRQPALSGALDGRFRVLFDNGNALTFSSRGELLLERNGSRPRIRGRLRLNDYVARVLDREADATEIQAARALAVVARSWILQNAPFEGGCYRVSDNTRMQRVSPNPPSAPALAAAWFTDGLMLKGQAVRYHVDQAAPGLLSWASTLTQAHEGRRFDEILASAFPRASLAATSGEEECRHLPEAEAWLARVLPVWRRRLASQPGFEPTGQPLQICGLDYGSPYVDRERSRLYVRGLNGREDRITIAHEYVHFAFRFHPSGEDEGLVEAQARALAE